jgi:hypothetical protein
MTSISRAPLSSSAKVVVGALALIGVIRLADFLFYGHRLEHLVAGIGFSLMGFGTFLNGFVTEDNSRFGRYCAGAGALLAVVSLFLQPSA